MSTIPEMGAIKWRDTGRRVRFAGMDGRLLVFLLICLYHPRLWTLGLMVVAIIGLIVLERMDYSLPNALRRLRVILFGGLRAAKTSRRSGRSDR